MTLFEKFLSGRYRKCLNYPLYILAVVLLLGGLAYPFIDDFRFDASADSLVARGDPALAYYEKISETFGGEGFLFFTYEPRQRSLFSKQSLDEISALQDQLSQLDHVSNVRSLLDVPLLRNPPVPLSELTDNIKTLRDDNADIELARQELTNSPFFRNLLVSADGTITAMRVDLGGGERLQQIDTELESLRNTQNLSAAQREELSTLESERRSAYRQFTNDRAATIASIRQIRDGLDGDVIAHVGGVPVVAADMIRYVRQDITNFGAAVVLIVAVMLYLLFRRWRWVLLPLLATGTSIYFTVALLGLLRQPVTVISSNFISLLTIVSISFSIHLIRRYRELRNADPDKRHVDLVFESLRDKFSPCFFTAITTMVAFGSLTTSSIVPIRDFGWIMCVSVLVAFVVAYSLFAGVLLLLPKGAPASNLGSPARLPGLFSKMTTSGGTAILVAALLFALVAVLGISRVSMDNKFINYFQNDTEIFESLAYIDTNLGGTIPMDITVEFDPYEEGGQDTAADPFSQPEQEYPERYWYTPDKIAELNKLQDYLAQQPEIGKVLSLATLSRIARQFNEGEPLNSVELVAVLGAVPDEFRAELLAPYAAPRDGLVRASARMHELNQSYSYDNLIAGINEFAQSELAVGGDAVRVTGMAVLFNNMLENLYSSQRSTLIFVILATLALFMVLLRSWRMALMGLLPNLLAAAMILAIMGFAGIPLDMMTITIAAIIIGIGVDDAIHYLHRYKHEIDSGCDGRQAVENTHKSIGQAIYYTSLTVIIGFSVLAFSNFVPTVYFGLLIALAMALAMIANLTVLPALLLRFYQR